ncbi:hypothetical protein FG386_000543 [Cryptosporidium ryanae]|uniref:uncharacterized protein n=1 Tax=Cryptosporidium ryanae TaxID=515981 RepID=UPI00351A3F74|nr:hypothetical protein FG386_000543 [Cryptosporidium ryanae]
MRRKQETSQSRDVGFDIINKVEIRIQDASLLSLSRSASISPECCGWLYVLNLKKVQGRSSQIGREISENDSEESWEQYYFSLKGGMLFGSSRKDGSTLEVVYVLCDTMISTIDSVTALQREYITREEEAVLRQNVGKDVHLIILLHYNHSLGIESNPLIFAASSPNVSARWCIAMNQSVQYGQMRSVTDNSDEFENEIINSTHGMSNDYLGVSRSYYRSRDVNQLSQQLDKLKHQYKQMEVENKGLKTKNDQLQGQVKKLQSALNVTEKATGEAVEQKTAELTQVLKDLENVRSEKELLLEEKRELHDKLADVQRYSQQVLLDKFEIMEELNDLQDNISSYKSGDAGLRKLINRLQYLKHSSQDLLIENRKYKSEIQSILDHYREEQLKSDKQLSTIKDLFSQHDIFQLLIRQIELVQAKLQYQQEAWKMPDNQAENLLFWIQQLQNQWKVDEAVARASYLKHRSIVLGEQMKSYLLGLPLPTHYAIIQELLHKLQYIFREEEFSIVTRSEFLYEDSGNTNSLFEPLNLNRNQTSANKQPIWDGNNFKQPPLAVIPSIFGSTKAKLINQANSNGNSDSYTNKNIECVDSSVDSSNYDNSGLIEYSSYKTSILGNSEYIPRIQVDLLSPPERNVPESEYERIKNSLRELQEKYRILEGENEIMSEKIQKLTKIIKTSNKKASYRQNTRTSSLVDFNSNNNIDDSIKGSYGSNSEHIDHNSLSTSSPDLGQVNANSQLENGQKNGNNNSNYPINNKLSSKNINFDLSSNQNSIGIENNSARGSDMF